MNRGCESVTVTEGPGGGRLSIREASSLLRQASDATSVIDRHVTSPSSRAGPGVRQAPRNTCFEHSCRLELHRDSAPSPELPAIVVAIRCFVSTDVSGVPPPPGIPISTACASRSGLRQERLASLTGILTYNVLGLHSKDCVAGGLGLWQVKCMLPPHHHFTSQFAS